MTTDLCVRLGEVLVDLLGSILRLSLDFLEDQDLLLPYLDYGGQPILPLLELLGLSTSPIEASTFYFSSFTSEG